MKLPKLNKQTLGAFFLHHTEKLVIAIALGLMAMFIWNGYKTEVFDETTPQRLSQLSDQAQQHILADDSWTQIVDSRQRVEVFPTIEADEGINSGDFVVPILSAAVKSLEPRKDPKLRPPTDLVAKQFTAPVFLAVNSKDPFDDLPFASEADAEDEDEDVRDRRRTTRRTTRPKREEKEEAKIPGEFVPLVAHHQTPGVRPSATRLGRSDVPILLDGIAVTGLVNVKQQYEDFESSFSYGSGYFPERDKPIYQYVQVERAEVVNGKQSDWKDISERLHEGQTRRYPAAAPEVVAPDNYDEVLTGMIPPITLVDYQDFSLHPSLEPRKFPKLGEEDEEAADGPGNPGELFSGGGDDLSAVGRRVGIGGNRNGRRNQRSAARSGRKVGSRRGSDKRAYEEAMVAEKPTAEHKLVRFYDLQAAQGKTYKYRVRLWLADANNDAEDALKATGGRGTGRGMGGDRGGDMGMDMDMDMDMDMGMDMDMDMGRGGGMTRGRGSSRGSENLGPDGLPKKVYKKIPITDKMKSPASRERLARAREEVDPDDRDRMIYYISEPRTDADGNTTFEEIPVPRRAKIDPDALFDLDLLRFARPTEWAETPAVRVTAASRTELAAGGVTPPREDRVGDTTIPDGEPVANLAVGIWSKTYNAFLPAMKQARRGELMNFTADANLLNPLTWAVHRAADAKIATDVVVVDAMGGQEVETGRTKELMTYRLPGEVLTMTADGTFKVHNSFHDQPKYRKSLFIHDESNEVGEVKKPKERDRRRGRGRDLDF